MLIKENCEVIHINNSQDSYKCQNFTFILPKNWIGNYIHGNAPAENLSVSEFHSLDEKQQIGISLYRYSKDFKDFIDSYASNHSTGTGSSVLSIRYFKVNNYSMAEISFGKTRGFKNENYYFIQNPSKTVIAEYTNIGGGEESQSLDNQIISNFKFNN